jgi:hypothetical protein
MGRQGNGDHVAPQDARVSQRWKCTSLILAITGQNGKAKRETDDPRAKQELEIEQRPRTERGKSRVREELTDPVGGGGNEKSPQSRTQILDKVTTECVLSVADL